MVKTFLVIFTKKKKKKLDRSGYHVTVLERIPDSPLKEGFTPTVERTIESNVSDYSRTDKTVRCFVVM